MLKRKLIVAVAALAVCAGTHPTGADARTWYVEKDGSGDYTVIQEAIDAASSGDTIQIGPGRYTEYRVHTPGAIVHYNQVISKSLTIVGAGAEETLIGHEDDYFADYFIGVGIIVLEDADYTKISHIGFDMPDLLGRGINSDVGDRIEVEHCRFTRCDKGGVFASAPGGGFVRNCEFRDIDLNYDVSGTAVTLYTPVDGFVVSDCVFESCFRGFGAFWSGCENIVVENCTFTGGRAGAGFTDGASGTIRNCAFEGQDLWCVGGNTFGTMIVEDNTIVTVGAGESARGFEVWAGPGSAIVRNNVIESDNICISILTPYIDLDLHGNHILQSGGQGWFARVRTQPPYDGPPVHFDLSGNWWGTTDVDYIAQWIHDGHDDPDMNYFFDFEPIADGPVPVDSRSLSEVKALFRD